MLISFNVLAAFFLYLSFDLHLIPGNSVSAFDTAQLLLRASKTWSCALWVVRWASCATETKHRTSPSLARWNESQEKFSNPLGICNLDLKQLTSKARWNEHVDWPTMYDSITSSMVTLEEIGMPAVFRIHQSFTILYPFTYYTYIYI